jgi:hypothetical protein
MKYLAALVSSFVLCATSLAETPAKEGEAHWKYIGRREITIAGNPKGDGVMLGEHVLEGRFVQQTWTIDTKEGASPRRHGRAMISYDAAQRVYRMWRFTSDGRPAAGEGVWDEAARTFTWTLKDPANGEATVVKSTFGKDGPESWEETTTSPDGTAVTISGKTRRGDQPPDSAAKVMEKYGSFAISDGSSWYNFSKDGTFKSGPMGMSGRTLEGKWAAAGDDTFTVVAKYGWINGLSAGDEYRRIVFRMLFLEKRPSKPEGSHFGFAPELFDAYWHIEEFVKVPKPE